jgi:hypothetical protein
MLVGYDKKNRLSSVRRFLITAVAFGLSQYPQICAAEPIDAGE